MEAIVIDKAEILIPNKQHKSFSGSNTFIDPGTKINGTARLISGLRKGKPFDYRLFHTKNNQYIFLNKINQIQKQTEAMNRATEVTLGADSQRSSTVINTSPLHGTLNPKLVGTLIGIGAGLAWTYSKRNHAQHTKQKMYMYIAVGALAGLGVGAYIEHRRAVVITPEK